MVRQRNTTFGILVLIVLIAFAVCLILSFVVLRHLFSSDAEFCTLSDTEYLAFTANLDAWIEEYAEPPTPRESDGTYEIILASLDGNEEYTAWAEYDWTPYSQGKHVDPAFFLPVGAGWPLTREGRNGYGYIYVPDSQLPYAGWSESGYEFQKLDNSVFCYRDVD